MGGKSIDFLCGFFNQLSGVVSVLRSLKRLFQILYVYHSVHGLRNLCIYLLSGIR